MSDGAVRVSTLSEGVVALRLDRPPVNALTPDFLAAVEEALAPLEQAAEVRAVVLAGEGRALSGGMDLKQLQGFSGDDQRAMVEALNRVFGRLYGFPKPVIAAAHGAAIAGGLFFVLMGDYRIAGEGALFGLAEVRVGVRFPAGPSAIARAELAGPACRRFMLGGANHDARTALALGVVDEVVPVEGVPARALAVARQYASLPPRTYAAIKQDLRGPVLARIDAACAGGVDPMAGAWFTDETIEATRSVLASLIRT